MKGAVLAIFLSALAFVQCTETDVHKVYSLCYRFEDEGNKELQQACVDSLSGVMKPADQTLASDDDLKKCIPQLPKQAERCTSEAEVGKCLLEEVKIYRDFLIEVFTKCHGTVLNVREKNQVHQIWISMWLAHMIKTQVSQEELNRIIEPALACFEPGLTPSDSMEQTLPDHQIDNAIVDEAGKAKTTRRKRDDAATKVMCDANRKYVKSHMKRSYAFFSCSIKKIAADPGSAEALNDYLKNEYEGVVPIDLIKALKLLC